MLRMIARRALLLLPILFGISIVSFVLIALSPSDPAEVAIRVNAMVPTPELIAQTRRELGLDEPMLLRYVHWLGGVLTGDFGRSYVSGRAVTAEIAEAMPPTLMLALATLAVILTVSVAGAVVCARYEGGLPDKCVRMMIFLTSALPGFWAGLLLMWLFAVELDLLPTSGMRGPSSIILPALTLSLAYISTYARLIRAEMIRTSHEGWVLFARGRGLTGSRITAHVLINSLRGAATALGMSIPKLIAGAFVVESIFAWPGVGRLCVTAIFNRDFPVIQAYVLIMAVMFVLFNLASDVFVAWLDPRESRGEGGSQP